jgi:hypothetical protein
MGCPRNRVHETGSTPEIWVPWCREPLSFVPDEQDAEVLARDGVSRGRVWTVGEIVAVMATSGSMRDGLGHSPWRSWLSTGRSSRSDRGQPTALPRHVPYNILELS